LDRRTHASHIVSLALSLGMAILTTRSAQAQEAADADRAEDILRQAAAKYRSSQTYRGSFTVADRVRVAGQVKTVSTKVSLTLKRPNKLRAQVEMGENVWTFASDGKTYWTYLDATQKYITQPAPPDLDGLLEGSLLGHMLYSDVMRVTLGLFRSDPYAVLMEDVESVQLSGVEQVAGERADHLTLQTASSTVDLWVSAKDSRIALARVHPWKLVQEAKQQHPELEAVTVEIAYAVAPSAPEEPSFAFEPPADAKQAQDLEDLLTVELVGRPLMDFTLPGLEEGTTWHLGDYRGRVIALDFWASWCPPCREELPKLQAIYNALRDKGFVLLAINTHDSAEKAAAFLKEQKLQLPVAVDTEGRVAEAYHVTAFPTLILIGRDTTIEAVHRGYSPGLEVLVRSQVEKLLAGESLSEAEG